MGSPRAQGELAFPGPVDAADAADADADATEAAPTVPATASTTAASDVNFISASAWKAASAA